MPDSDSVPAVDAEPETPTQPEVTDTVDEAAPTAEKGAPAEPEVLEWVEPDQDWAHEWIEFEGDKLAVRRPTLQALAGYSLSASQFVTPQTQNDISGLFMSRHMSPGTYLHVMDRFMSPDDPDYTDQTVGELMKLIVELRTGEDKPENRSERRHPG